MNEFANVYEEIFNREKDENNLKELLNSINSDIGNDAQVEIERIDSNLIKEALKKIKPNKSDPLCDFSSDFLKNAPEMLYVHLAAIIRAFFLLMAMSVVSFC